MSIQISQQLTNRPSNRSLSTNDSDAAFTFTVPPSADGRTVTVSHQVPPIATGTNSEAHPAPWFNIASTESPMLYQWQIHPVEHGPLRYTLIELPSPDANSSAVEPQNQRLIKAIYHNVGVGTSLVQPFSEGVLLLPKNNKDMNAELETAVVASLMGLLWKARGIKGIKSEVPGAKDDTTEQSSKKSGSFFRKSWKDEKEDKVIR